MACAVDGPTPGSASSSVTDARLMLTTPLALGEFVADATPLTPG